MGAHPQPHPAHTGAGQEPAAVQRSQGWHLGLLPHARTRLSIGGHPSTCGGLPLPGGCGRAPLPSLRGEAAPRTRRPHKVAPPPAPPPLHPPVPHSHQLPPVRPSSSFFSEFQMNFFQLPSPSLAFPRAMASERGAAEGMGRREGG